MQSRQEERVAEVESLVDVLRDVQQHHRRHEGRPDHDRAVEGVAHFGFIFPRSAILETIS